MLRTRTDHLATGCVLRQVISSLHQIHINLNPVFDHGQVSKQESATGCPYDPGDPGWNFAVENPNRSDNGNT